MLLVMLMISYTDDYCEACWRFITAKVRKPIVYPLPCIQVKLMLILIYFAGP